MRRKSWHICVTSGDRHLYNLCTDRKEDAMQQAQKFVANLRLKIVEREYDERETVLLDRSIIDG